MTFDGAGNTLDDAKKFNITSTTQIFTDSVGELDKDDYYRFSIGSNSDFNLELDGLSNNANLWLLDINGNTIASSFNSGNEPESITGTILPGDYYIRINPTWGYNINTGYNLSVSATALDFAGNTLEDARQITLDGNGTTQTFKDWVGELDKDDYYRFSIGSDSDFNIELDGLSNNANVRLLDINGNTIASSFNSGNQPESISGTILPGDYYIHVNPTWGYNINTSYDLNITTTALDFAGNTLEDARQITLDGNGTTQTFKDWVGELDKDDYYRFSIGSDSDFNIELDGLSNNANVRLLDINGNTIASSFNSGNQPESISGTILPGDYYIHVNPTWGYNINTSYDLNITTTVLGESEQPNTQQPQQSNPEAWTQQLGTEGDDFSNGIAVDSAGNVYITGYNDTSIGGTVYYDIWLAKYDSGGNELWKTELGITGNEFSYSVAVDDSGNAYITGHSEDVVLEDGYDNGRRDYKALIAKYDSDGSSLWIDQVSYTGENEYSYSIAVDSTNHVYMTGVVSNTQRVGSVPNTWLSKHSSDGEEQWRTKLNAYAESTTVEADGAGNIYVAGYFDNFFGEKFIESAWITKYDSSGEQTSFEGLDTLDFDIISNIDIDVTGNVYIVGSTTYEPSKGTYSGDYDALVAKYDITGELLWTKQLDGIGDDFASNIEVSDDGNVYITAETQGTIEAGNPGTQNNWVAKYSSDGSLIWTQELDIASENFITDMTVGDTGNIYITGETGNWSNANSFEDIDAFVAKYVEPI